MSTAIYTFKTIAEMSSMFTEHPIRGVQNGDIGLIVGDDVADDILVYTATITGEPVNLLPDSVASSDGKVQWDVTNRTYGSGNIPRSTQVDTIQLQGHPDGWSLLKNGGYKEWVFQSGIDSTWGSRGWLIGTDLWIINTYFYCKIELANGNKWTRWKTPPFTSSAYGNIAQQAVAYCALDGLIHIVGIPSGAGQEHHTINVADGVLSVNSKLIPPLGIRYGVLYDNSTNDGRMYLFNNDTSNRNIYVYDVLADGWPETITSRPNAVTSEVTGVATDFSTPGCLLVACMDEKFWRFNIASNTWEPLSPPGAVFFYRKQPFFWDEVTQRYMWIDYDVLARYDATTNTWDNTDNYFVSTCDAVIPVGDGYFVKVDNYVMYGVTVLFTMCEKSTYIKE